MDINLDISVHSYQSKSAKTVLDTILEIQPKDSSGGGSGETRESIVYRICDDMLEKLPNDYDPFEVKARLEKMGRLQPMNIFLKQEIDRMQRVISLVRSTLSDLKLAIDGTIIMSESLRDALDCMYDARIPKLWQKVSANVSYLWNIKTKSIILKLDICIIIYQVFEIGIYFEFLFCDRFHGIPVPLGSGSQSWLTEMANSIPGASMADLLRSGWLDSSTLRDSLQQWDRSGTISLIIY